MAFPLISNTQAGGPATDLEMLMRGYRWFAPVYTIGILLLYYLFWLVMKTVLSLKKEGGTDPNSLKIFVLVFGLLFSFTLVWLYPITANDLFRYVLRGRVWAVYGESPMLVPPNAFPDDPYIAFAGEFGHWVSGYGPLWEIVVQAPLRLGATDMVAGSIGLKLIAMLSYLFCSILIGWFAIPEKSTSLAALTFFAWNPLVLMQGIGNGHNDMVFMALMVLGIILWQRKIWWAAALILTLSVMAKASAILLIPFFGITLLRHETSWGKRIIKGGGAIAIGLLTAYSVYSVLGPVSDTLKGVSDMLTTRKGFAIASGTRMLLREIIPLGADNAISPDSIPGVTALREASPCQVNDNSTQFAKIALKVVPCNVAETIPRTTSRYIFILFYLWLLLELWRGKLNLVTAGFLAYFSQLMLGRTFRIWYPLWLIPLASLHLSPALFWRSFLFSLTAELSIINYFVVWRWWLSKLPWEKLGLLAKTGFYWPIMHTLTVPWLFGIPLFGPMIMKRWKKS